MINGAGGNMQRPNRHGGILRKTIWLLLCLIPLTLVTGCGGCSSTPDPEAEKELAKKLEEERRRKEEENKEPLEIKSINTQPNDMERIETAFKPGHWTSCAIQAIANRDDFSGELVTEPFALPGLPFRLGTSRPAILPKKQARYLETVLYIPPGEQGQKVTAALRPRNSYQDLALTAFPAQRMPEYQFFFFVLAADPLRYQPLKEMPTFQVGPERFYRLLLPRIESRTPLPEGALTWTSIAYVLWDDINPEIVLTERQQQALIDWVHWGGRLIVSGPGSYDVLKDSFLGPYLPIESAEAGEVTGPDVQQFNTAWTLPGSRPLEIVKPWSTLEMEVRQDPDTLVLAKTDDGRPFIVERSVGQGSVLMTSFRLSQRELLNWPSFDGFFSSCIAGRANRDFRMQDFELTWNWADGSSRLNAERMSQMRYFTRDARLTSDVLRDISGRYAASQPGTFPELRYLEPTQRVQGAPQDNTPDWSTPNWSTTQSRYIGPGVAGWDNFSAASELSRAALRRASGIVIPKAMFVVKVLGAYLFVLVVVNWTFFRLIGRVEWAWIAAPVITVGFAIGVVYMAQLDIGFVRSRTELGIIELQPEYARAHVTRYTALYTSLATTYDLDFADENALVQPFPRFFAQEDRRAAEHSETTVNYHLDKSATLSGFTVPSNSTGMLHSEQLIELGTIHLVRTSEGDLAVKNDTKLHLHDVGVMRGSGQAAWLGELAPGEQKPLEFETTTAGIFLAEHWSQSPATGADSPLDVLNVGPMLTLAVATEATAGTTCLVGRTEETLGGLDIEPRSSQGRYANVVIAHLSEKTPDRPRRDINSPAVVKRLDSMPLSSPELFEQ